MIKIDLDGKELDVLEGMTRTLEDTECVIVETVFFGEGPNNFYTVIDFMRNHDFVIYNIIEPLYRPADMALWQVDTFIVKEADNFASHNDMPTRKQ